MTESVSRKQGGNEVERNALGVRVYGEKCALSEKNSSARKFQNGASVKHLLNTNHCLFLVFLFC